jgi:signal transduction histidine kinase
MWLGVAVAVTMVAILVALLHADTGGNLEAVIGQTLMNSALFVVILIFAAVLRAFDQQHAELLLVNERLTEAMDASRDLVLAQERARAAAELHDGLGQQLTLVSMSLDYADRTRARDPEPAWAEVANASVVVKQALADMRLWVRALHPARLDQLTEPSAFESVAEVFRGTGLDVQVEIAPDERLERPHALFAYRLIQEGLTTALRHARATRVVFRIERDADGLRLTVGDNGAGDGEIQPGFGLRGLTERAEELGGTLRLNRPGGLGGLDVIAELPAVTA